MKKIDIGDKTYSQCESPEDLNIGRYPALKEYILYKQTGVDNADLVSTLGKFCRDFDNNSKSQMLITLYDYMTGLNMAKNKKDPDQFIYALMTLEDDEDPSKFDETHAKEKLSRMSEAGLTQGQIVEAVTAFMEASKLHFVTSFLMSSQV